ncbi:MAG TPA: ATP-binding protein [Terriglobales bacterium]|nr:ATP-binding protein [Terriglobales bacterium]
MSLRWRLFLVFGAIVVITVALVSYAVSTGARQAFQRLDEQRTTAIIGQFRREFQMQGNALTAKAHALADSQDLRSMAVALSAPGGDPAPYVNLASSLAAEQQLDFLEILTQDGTIISSAEWPARFGLREDWITASNGWNAQPAFLRFAETPQGKQLALVVVQRVASAERSFLLVAGKRMDSSFLSNLVLPEGTRLLLWQSGELADSNGSVTASPELKTLVEESAREAADLTRRVRLDSSPDSAVAHTIPLLGLDSKHPLAILVVASSRRELNDLQARIRGIGTVVALIGILLSVIASVWWAARISRPVEELSEAAGDVAAGNWERKVPETGNGAKGEVGQLIASFNRMTEELLRQRDRAVQAERVAAWRELARRLAHELKNPLFPLQITVENLMRARQQHAPDFDEIFVESTTTLLAELSNLRKIVGRFSDFSKMPAPHCQTVDVNAILREVVQLFAPQLSSAAKPIALETSFEARPAEIEGDPDLLRKAFENLILNAIDAMPNGGRLGVTTASNDGQVTVAISDSGAGLTEEEASRLFTPYYTTKHHGTGLGLAIVQSVISDHGARIFVSSRKGEGATFRMEFQRKAQSTTETQRHGEARSQIGSSQK